MDAWETLISGSSLPISDAWGHLNAQSGSGGYIFVDTFTMELKDDVMDIEVEDADVAIELEDIGVEIEIESNDFEIEV